MKDGIFAAAKKFMWPCLFLGVFLAAMKIFCLNAGPGELDFLLAPAVGVVRFLTGDSFRFLEDVGYIHASERIAVTPACSGVKLWGAAAVISVFLVFLNRKRPFWPGGIGWCALCVFAGYLLTVPVNGIRIAIAIDWYSRLANGTAGCDARTVHVAQGALVELAGLAVFSLAVLFLSRKVFTKP